MTAGPEWLVTPGGEVMLSLPLVLPAAPHTVRVLPNGEVSVEHADGGVRVAPGRRIGAVLSRRASLVVTEFDPDANPVRATRIDITRPGQGARATPGSSP